MTMSDRREQLRKFAQDTLKAIDNGSYILDGTTYDLHTPTDSSKRHTTYHPPVGSLDTWASNPPSGAARCQNEEPPNNEEGGATCHISILEVSTLEGARYLHNHLLSIGLHQNVPTVKVGILNFASARKPGGGFLSGAQAQEESIARASTLYPTLMTRVAQAFYTLHNRDQKGGYYTHAMVYSPGVTVFRDDEGAWVAPYAVDVVTSAAVNAGVVRNSLFGRAAGESLDGRIEKVMHERMARILYLFEQQGIKHIVLGSFGTGVFKNKVATVAGIWADLLVEKDARFKNSFEHVVFAILGKKTYDTFREVLESRVLDTSIYELCTDWTPTECTQTSSLTIENAYE